MVTKTREEVAQISGQVRDYIKVNNSLPTLITFNDGTKVNQATFLRMMCVAIAQIKTGDKTGILTTSYNNPANSTDSVTSNAQLLLNDYVNLAYNTKEYIAKTGTVPVQNNTQKYGYLSFYGLIWTFSRVLGYYHDNPEKLPVKTLPNYVVLENKFSVTTAKKSQLRQAAEGVLGEYSTALQLYNRIDALGTYMSYYDDIYDIQEELQRLKDHLGINCTDSMQLYYWLVLDLNMGYEVHFEHIKCASGTGHVRGIIRGNEFNSGYTMTYISKYGKSFVRVDPAKAIDESGSVTPGNVWCLSGSVIAYDPQWLLNPDDGKT